MLQSHHPLAEICHLYHNEVSDHSPVSTNSNPASVFLQHRKYSSQTCPMMSSDMWVRNTDFAILPRPKDRNLFSLVAL